MTVFREVKEEEEVPGHTVFREVKEEEEEEVPR